MSLIDAKPRTRCEPRQMPAVIVIVELDESDPITGRVGLDGADREPFEGLLELLVAFDRLRRVEPATGGGAPEEPGEV
jgi:hypothetical protein